MSPAQSPPAIIDLEASGFGRGSYPIEVGFVLSDGESYCSLIRPPEHWKHWDEGAEQLHHITPGILAQHGKPAIDVARALNERLCGKVVYSDGWMNDYSWLGRLYDEVEMTPTFKVENLRALLSEEQAALWHRTKQAVLAETSQNRHRASIDARVIQETVSRVRAAGASRPDADAG